jgi:hypothetical protein
MKNTRKSFNSIFTLLDIPGNSTADNYGQVSDSYTPIERLTGLHTEQIYIE